MGIFTEITRQQGQMNKYQILLVDDHQIMLEGLRTIIDRHSEKFFVRDIANNATEAIGLLKTNHYDILITDYELPEMTGIELIQLARTVSPEIKTIVLSMHDEPAMIREIMSTEVDGYVSISKNDSHDCLKEALERVVNGKIFLSSNITDYLIHAGAEKTTNDTLTPRETEILRLVAKEYSTKQIAEILLISEKTVETHRKNILKKTKATGLVGLIKYAYMHNLI